MTEAFLAMDLGNLPLEVAYAAIDWNTLLQGPAHLVEVFPESVLVPGNLQVLDLLKIEGIH